MKSTAEIVAAGNELLIGQTLDTNSNWIGRQLTSQGWRLRRVTTVLDSLPEIEEGVRDALGRKPGLLLTVGGLGPTPDDMTLKGLARALGVPLTLNHEALGLIREHYRSRFKDQVIEITVSRRKMAMLPRGARPVRNPVGTAPAVAVEKGKTRIFCLPGVPREMKAIFEESIVPFLKAAGGRAPKESTLRILGIVESMLAPVIVKMRRKFPGLYFKSHPRGVEAGKPLILLHVYNVEEEWRDKMDTAVTMLIRDVKELGAAKVSRV